ncbi:MAG: hypothetical protein IKA75_10865 [Bacteroidaceae bacterium]|nr:hypothetical protein [Bacteroidaceae bacterium]
MMKKIFTKGFIAVAMVAVVGFVSSCKDYNDEIMAEYRGEDAKLASLIDELLTKHNQDIQDAKDARDAMKRELDGLIQEIQAKDNNQSDSLKTAYDDAKWAVDSIGKLDARIETLEDKVSTLEELKAGERLDALEGNVEDLEEIVNALVTGIGDSTSIADWIDAKNTDVATLQSEIATAKGAHESVAKRLESIENSITGIETCAVNCEALQTWVDETKPKITSLEKMTDKNRVSIDSMATAFKLFKASYNKKVNELRDSINSVKAAYQAADKILADSIAGLRSDLTELEGRVKANEEAIDSIFGRLDALEEDVEDLKDGMKNRISSVLVQGAYSPVVGYFNIPFGMKSNILAAYKGSALSSAIQFPFKAVDGSVEAFTQDIASKLNSETIDEIGDGYAGKLYLTINPAEVDLDSVDFALVNSQDDLAPVKLDSVVVSSDVLKFGYTRAGAPLYEATATITDVNAASLDLNLGDYKDILTDLRNRKVNLSEIASTLYSSINEMADANAVQASWTDSLGEHTVYSDFAVAAVAVKPLSFNTFAAIDDIDEIPGLDRVYNTIDNAINRINVDITIGEFKDIKVTLNKLDLDKNNFKIDIDTTLTVEGQTVTIYEKGQNTGLFVKVGSEELPIVVGEDVKVDVKGASVEFTYYNDDIVKEILNIENTVNGQFSKIEDVIEQVNSMLAQINGIETNINQSIADAKEDIKNEIHKYLDKLNNKLCNVINSAKDKVNAAMFVKATDGFGVLSQSKNMPTVIENGAVLVPTTYTAELVVPVYKKFVAITAVDGSTDNLAAVNTGDLNKVLDGGVRAVEFNGESGKTYELTYAALDYAGYVSTVKYYVTVK